MIPENIETPLMADCPSAPCSADGLLRGAKEHLYDAFVCNRMGKPAHSVGYLRLAMEKLAVAEKALLGLNDWCACEKPGPHFHTGSRGKFCAVCGKDILPNVEVKRGDTVA